MLIKLTIILSAVKRLFWDIWFHSWLSLSSSFSSLLLAWKPWTAEWKEDYSPAWIASTWVTHKKIWLQPENLPPPPPSPTPHSTAEKKPFPYHSSHLPPHTVITIPHFFTPPPPPPQEPSWLLLSGIQACYSHTLNPESFSKHFNREQSRELKESSPQSWREMPALSFLSLFLFSVREAEKKKKKTCDISTHCSPRKHAPYQICVWVIV